MEEGKTNAEETQPKAEDGGDDSSPDSTPLAAGRSLPNPAASSDKPSFSTIDGANVANANEPGASDIAEEPPKDVAPPPPPPSKSVSLGSQIQALNSLRQQIALLRSLPARLLTLHTPHDAFDAEEGRYVMQDTSLILNGPIPDPAAVTTSGDDTIGSFLFSSTGKKVPEPQSISAKARKAFQALEDAHKQLRSEVVQDGLRHARDGSLSDNSELSSHGRRERKRRRTAFAESPAPFPSFQMQKANVFPADPQSHKTPFTYSDLLPYLRRRNRGQTRERSETKVQIWFKSKATTSKSRAPQVSEPVTVRVLIPDVATVFVNLTFRSLDRDPLVVESVVALGPREKKSPYSHSDFSVYQKVTQCISRTIEREPNVSFPQLIDYLSSFESLFVGHCKDCESLLSLEGYVPPVARIWVEKSSSNAAGVWEPRHGSCLRT